MNTTVKEELEFIRKNNGGFLKPEHVVEYARDDSTELHKYFEWNDGEAAEKYRILQARSIIRVSVNVLPETNEKVRAFVSLSTDRKSNLGYRAVVDVLNDEDLLHTLLQDAKNELDAFRKKYANLKKMALMKPLFNEIDAVIQTNDAHVEYPQQSSMP